MKRIYLLLIAILLMISFFNTSCKKTDPPKASITVIGQNEDGQEIYQAGAVVLVKADPNTHDEHGNTGLVRPDLDSDEGLYVKGNTDSGGKVNFDFKYEAILRVYAYIVPKKSDTIWGEGAIILKENEVYNETVYLRYPQTN
jgi:hypothetical protein